MCQDRWKWRTGVCSSSRWNFQFSGELLEVSGDYGGCPNISETWIHGNCNLWKKEKTLWLGWRARLHGIFKRITHGFHLTRENVMEKRESWHGRFGIVRLSFGFCCVWNMQSYKDMRQNGRIIKDILSKILIWKLLMEWIRWEETTYMLGGYCNSWWRRWWWLQIGSRGEEMKTQISYN